MKRFGNVLIAAVVASSLMVTPVFATPSMEEIKKNKAQTEQQLKDTNDQLITLLTDFEVLKGDISNQKVRIKKADKELQKAKKLEEKQYREMLVRIKYMYEKGEASEAAALLGAESFGEIMNQVEYIQSVHKYDRKMLTEYRKTKEKVAKRKAKLEADEADMEFMADTYKTQQKELNTAISKMKSKIADFDVQYAKAKREADERARKLQEETRRMEEELRRQKALEKAQKEEAKRREEAKKKEEAAKPADKPSKPKPSKPSKPSTDPVKPSSRPEKPSQEEEKPSKPAEKPSAPPSGNDNSNQSSGSDTDTAPEKPSNVSKGQQIANEGMKYIGNPYVWGGNSLTNGIDCSGFTSKIHSICGIGGVPRQSGSQRSGGKAVNGLANALPGDIICYDGHVAIYIGGGQIVHASNPSPYPKGGIKTGSATYRTILAIRRYW